MSKSPQATGGGTATHAGTNYQNRVAAWTAVQILAEQSAVPPWDLPSTVSLESLHAETPHAVDDLGVQTSAGGNARSQAKHTLSLQSAADSPFGSAISQCVREYRAANPPLDAAKDRLVIVTTSLSSAPIKTHLPPFLTRFRSSSAPEKEWTSGNSQENDAAATLKEHLVRVWRSETGADPGPAEIAGVLKLLRIQILDVDDGGNSEREAKLLLRAAVLVDPTQADAAWNTLIAATANYAQNSQRADRAALQRVLTDAGIEIKAARSFQDDIGRLQKHTAATLSDLVEYSRIQVGGADIIIDRAAAPELLAAGTTGHLLVLGMPGAGKSGALHHLALELDVQKADVVLFAVDKIEAASTGALRTELNLEHELLDVLQSWPGTAPGYLIIDALDAARSDGAVKTLQTVIREVTSANGRWHVIASVRKFDLRYDTALQRLFKGTPPSSPFVDGEFGLVRHLNVPVLSETELAQVSAQSPVLGALVSEASPQLKELLHLPFNLRLLADLLDAGLTQAELKPVRTQIELLDKYWRERIIGHDHKGDAREVVLRRVVNEMVKQRVLRIARAGALQNDAASGTFLEDLLSKHVLAEWTTQTGLAQRDFLTFPHHLLFDYAVARLFAPPDAPALIQLLGAEPDLLIAIRPSIELHFHRLWHQDQLAFWGLTLGILESPINEIGKLLGPSVAALLAKTKADIQPLLDCVSDAQRRGTGIAALRHILATLLTYGLTAGMVGPGPWAEFLDTATATMMPELAHSIRPYVNFLASKFSALDAVAAQHVGNLTRRMLSYALAAKPFNALMAINAITGVTETVTTDPDASIAVLRQCIDKDHLIEHGFRTFPTLSHQATALAKIDPDFVCDIYVAGFEHREQSDEKTMMGDSQILPMSSNRRQDFEMGQWSLSEQFPRFLEAAPRPALAALIPATEAHVTNRRKAERDIVPVFLDGIESGLWRDNSFIWDGGADQIENVPKMLYAFRTYLSGLSDPALLRELMHDIAAHQPPGTIWRLLLSTGTEHPSTVGLAIRSLAWDYFILTERDTTSLAGDFLRAIFPLLEPEERTRVEDAIMAIPSRVPERPDAAGRARDRLLGCLDRALLTTPAATARCDELDTAGGPPENRPDPRIEISHRAFAMEDFLREQGVPLEDPEHARLLALTRPIGEFGSEFLNDTPDESHIRAILPDLRALDAETPAIQSLHPELRSQTLTNLAEACEAVLRNDAFPFDTETLDLFRAIILRAAADADAEPDPERDEAFQKHPSWGASPRLEGAQALMALAHRSAELTAELRPVILRLSEDPVATVRFQVARRAGHLFRTDRELMWSLLERFCAEEANRGVLQGALDVLQGCANVDPPRVAALALRVFERMPEDGDGVNQVRDQCCNLFSGLGIWHQEPVSLSVLERMLSSPGEFRGDLSRVIFDLSAWLHEKNEDVRTRTFQLLDRILDVLLASARAVDAALGNAPFGTLPEAEQERYGGFLKNIDSIAMRLHLNSGATRGNQSSNVPPDAGFYRSAKPLLQKLAAMGHPHTAHSVVETLVHFVPVDPPGVLLLIAEVLRAASAQNYHYEQLGEELIVRLIERYLAEYRPMLRERPDCHAALMEILDIFVRVGWPQAHQLTYRLGEIYR